MSEIESNQEDDDLNKFIKCDIFTPDTISKLMADKLHKNGSLLEPSVGTGNLLKYINFENYNRIDVYELKNDYLQLITNNKINKYNTDFLKKTIIEKYKNIILNPPYIKIQDLSIEYRKFIKTNFTILNKGMIDIYYAFILKCIDLLTNDGIMVSITPNTYLYNKSALPLRSFLLNNKLIKEIKDFGTEKIFSGISVYCCITVFTKEPKDYFIYNDNKIKYIDINKSDYNIFNVTPNNVNPSNVNPSNVNPSNVNSSNVNPSNVSSSNVNSSNVNPSNVTVQKTLKDICKISNGIATLRDTIYIHKEKLFDEPCWVKLTNSKDIKYIIYPYNNGKIINEDDFKQSNPNTYNYLLKNKDELSKRDKGNKEYATWYAYGRTQSLLVSKKENVIYLPCFINPDNITIDIKPPMLYQSCLCIEPNNNTDIIIIKNTILNNIEFIKSISSKRSGGWINLSSSNLYKIPLVTSD